MLILVVCPDKERLRSQGLNICHQIIDLVPTQPSPKWRHIALAFANDSPSLGFTVLVRSCEITAQRGSERLSGGAAVAAETILLENYRSGLWRTSMAAAQTGTGDEQSHPQQTRFHRSILLLAKARTRRLPVSLQHTLCRWRQAGY